MLSFQFASLLPQYGRWDYELKNARQRKRIRYRYNKKEREKNMFNTLTDQGQIVSLDHMWNNMIGAQAQRSDAYVQTAPAPEQKGKKPMCYECEEFGNPVQYSAEREARSYLSGRLSEIHSEKYHELETAYGLRVDNPPSSAKELIERIQAGKYEVPSDRLETTHSYDPLRYFVWRDPSVKRDPDGFTEALTVLNAARTEVQDAIYVNSAADALAAVQEFSEKKFH